MTYHIDAIYDDGVLKPLAPLKLPDKALVKLTIESEAASGAESEILARQQAVLDELRKAAHQIPKKRNNDGWSVRQHDELLYDRLQ
jgi:predicted DNA-binding antitoxin AbrB/MazE fold protein